jgi:hypothetical protein
MFQLLIAEKTFGASLEQHVPVVSAAVADNAAKMQPKWVAESMKILWKILDGIRYVCNATIITIQIVHEIKPV